MSKVIILYHIYSSLKHQMALIHLNINLLSINKSILFKKFNMIDCVKFIPILKISLLPFPISFMR